MRNLAFLAAVVAVCATAGPAYGQSARTWVSENGNDVNPCSATAPCKTFAGAISKTTIGGEIDALDDAGFGALTITKSITVRRPQAQGAGDVLCQEAAEGGELRTREGDQEEGAEAQSGGQGDLAEDQGP
jgi:hypothetical protein